MSGAWPVSTDRHVIAQGPAASFDDPGSHEMLRFVTDNARMWLRDDHLDELRLDAARGLERELGHRLMMTVLDRR